jgi:hypothetical protein
MVIDGAGGDGMMRFGENVKPITEPTTEPASTYNASALISKSNIEPPSSSAPTTTKPPMQTTPSVEAPPEVTASTPSPTASFLTTQTTPSTTQTVLNPTSEHPTTPIAVSTTSSAPLLTKTSTQPTPTSVISPTNITPPSSQPQLQPEIVEVNGHLVGGYLPGLQPALVSETLMPGGGSTGGIIVPKQPPVGVVSELVLPPGASEKLHESPPTGTTGTVQIGNLTFSGVRVVNLSTPTTTPKETTPSTSGGSSGTTHETGTPPSSPITSSLTGSLGTGGTPPSKSSPPHEMPTPIPVPIGGSENPPAKLVSEPILPPGKEFAPPSGSTGGTSHEVGAPPSTPVGGSHTSSQPPGGGTTTPKSTPPHAILPTPIPAPPSQPPVKLVSETVHAPPSEGGTPQGQEQRGIPPQPAPPSTSTGGVRVPGSEHNAIPITPIEGIPAPPHVTPLSETRKAPTNVITHLWIGWRIEPEVEEFIRRFIETFTHGRPPRIGGAPPPGAPHLRPPIMLPAMGIAPTPGTPLVILPPQGTEQKQRVTA